MQVQLFDNGDIIAQYKNVSGVSPYQGQTGTVGIESPTLAGDAITGLRYLYNGTLPSALNLLTNGLAIKYYQFIPTTDVAAVSYDAPHTGFTGSAVYPAASVKNNGTATVTAGVTIKIFGPLPAMTEVFNATETTGPITAGVTLPYTFTAHSWTPATLGNYACSVYVTTAGDQIATNNTKTGSAVIINTATLPYSTDFEANNGGFFGTGEWEWGTPTDMGSSAAHSPVKCWGTDLDSAYNAYSKNTLYSPAIPLTGAPIYSLDFWMWYYFEGASYDGANLKITTDNGLTWEILTTSVAYTGTVTGTTDTLMLGQQVWGGIDTIWTPVSVDLTPYAGQTIILKIDQGSDLSVQYAGIYIDDLSITQIFADVAVASIDLPAEDMLFPVHTRSALH